MYEYANHLVARGHHVAIVHPAARVDPLPFSQNFYMQLRRKAGVVRNTFFKPSVDWQYIDPRVEMLYVANLSPSHIPDADAVIATFWTTAEYVFSYPLSKGKKWYLIQHYEAWDGWKEQVDATWRAPLPKIVITKWLFEIGRELGVPAAEMRHIPNGINHEVFKISKPLANRPPRVAMMYSDVEWKGLADGIRALEIVKAEIPDLRAVLFGVSKKPLGLPSWVKYFPNPAQSLLVEKIYNESSVYLCPSWAEGFALPPAEALACGCALVSTDCGGIREYAEHEKTALLSSPKDPDALARNLISLMKDERLRTTLAQAGNEVIKQFTWKRSTDSLEGALSGNETRENSKG